MTKIKYLGSIALAIILAWPVVSPAQTQCRAASDPNCAGYSRTSSTATPTPAPTATPVKLGSGININQGSKKASKNEMIGVGLNLAAAAMLYKASARCKAQPHGPYLCVLAGIQVVQAGIMASAKSGSDSTAGLSQLGGGYDFDGSGTVGDDPGTNSYGDDGSGTGGGSGGLSKLTNQARDITGKLKEAGIWVSKDGTKAKIGTGDAFSTAALQSKDSMMDLGLSGSAADQLEAAKKKVSADLAKKYNGALAVEDNTESGGRQMKAAASGDEGEPYDPMAAFLAAQKRAGAKREPTNVAGMQKQFGTDMIGVPGDNIFQMITRRYKAKEQQKYFFDDKK